MVVAGRSWGLPSLHCALGPVCNSYQLFHLCVVAAAACLLVLEQCCLGGYTESMTGRSQELPSLRCMCCNDRNPGAFNLVFYSHQSFHLCMVAARLVHYRGVRTLLTWRDATGRCVRGGGSLPSLTI